MKLVLAKTFGVYMIVKNKKGFLASDDLFLGRNTSLELTGKSIVYCAFFS